ncbi:erythromycin esterase family protein [Spirosoma arcticum]
MRRLTTYLYALLAMIAGVWARPAVAQQPVSSTITPVEAQRLEPGNPIERELKAGETHRYTVALTEGQFLDAAVNQRGIDVMVRVVGPSSLTVAEIDSPNGDQGDELIGLEAKATGTYRIDVSSLEKDARPGRYEVRVNAVLSPEAYAARVAEALRKQQAVISWLKTNAIPLKTVEAGNGFADLQPLKKTLRDVRFVGLGEATHGTREFFQVKHRLLEFLVCEMGYRVFALEGSYSALQVINDYVMGRMDDGTKALDGQGFAVWNTEEVRAMLDWARAYNAGVTAGKRVKFIGFDMQVNKPGKERLRAYLRQTAPDRATRTDSLLAIDEENLFSTAFTQQQTDAGKAAGAKLNLLKIPYNDLYTFLESNRTALVAKSSEADYEQMHEYARMLVQFIDMAIPADSRQGPAIRDRYMAENFTRLVNQQPASTRVVVWAHNSHIATDDNGSFVPIGAYLRKSYGPDYYALGLVYNQGSFQASGTVDVSAKRVMRQFTVKPAPAGSADWYLAQTGIDKFVIDFRAGQQNGDVRHWLTTPQPVWGGVGWYFKPEYEASMFQRTAPISKLYDGLLFIETTTRARPNPSVKSDLRGDK